MKKMMVIPMIVLMLVMMATSVKAATSLADEIYAKGAGYGVTEAHKEKMQRYFTNYPVTDAQRATILEKADECIDVMKKAGVTDVTKLSKSDLEAVEAKVQSAANVIGLQVSFNGTDFTVSKDGKTLGEYHVQSSNGTTTTSSNKFVYTGSNSTLALSSIAMAVVALVAVVKLRKNA